MRLFKSLLYRYLCAKDNEEEFWLNHKRYAPTKAAKDLLCKIFVPIATNRITTDEILSDDWASGPVLNDSELKGEMMRRHEIVEDEVSQYMEKMRRKRALLIHEVNKKRSLDEPNGDSKKSARLYQCEHYRGG